MAITFIGSDIGHSGANTNPIALTLPAHATDDVGIIFAKNDTQGGAATQAVTIATGWTELVQEELQTNRPTNCAIFYKRFTSSSETNPTLTISAASRHSASVHVFRGVDTSTIFDVAFTSSATANTGNPTQPNITTGSDNCCIVALHSFTHSEMTAAGAPTGYVLAANIVGIQHRGQSLAYLLDAGAAATESPGTWNNSGTFSTQDNANYTLALRNLAGGVEHEGSVTFSGIGSLVSAGVRVANANTTFSGIGSLATSGLRTTFADATFSGIGSLDAAGVRVANANTTFSGIGSLDAAGVRVANADVTFSGIGSLSTAGVRTANADVTFSGIGSLAAAGVRTANADVTFSGIGSLATSGLRTTNANITFSGIGSLSTAGARSTLGAVTFSGTSSLDANGLRTTFGDVTFSGTGSLDVEGVRVTNAAVIFSGTGNLEVNGIIPTRLIVEDGSSVTDANSYISLEYANDYHGLRNNTLWTGSSSARETAIILATDYFEINYGSLIRGTQLSRDGLSFPRNVGTAYYNNGNEIEPVPDNVRKAIADSALSILSVASVATTGDGTSSISRTIGSASEKKGFVSGGAMVFKVSARFVEGILKTVDSFRA